ncbi:MAG TPA: hypothetical protein VG898_00345 [Solirubrobacterales bacterium]|nr:hypothetical protein [Solirubrobacterales bacterium]
MDQVVQVIGAVLILVAYIAAQLERLDPSSRLYLGLNLAGSLILAVLAASGSQWGFLLLECAWAIVSLWGLVGAVRSAGKRASAR